MAQERENKTKKAFCTACGAPIFAGDAFCTACGAPIDGQSAGAGGNRNLAIGIFAAVVAVAAAGYFYVSQEETVQRAVPGSATASAPRGNAGPGANLPDGHPSVALPQEILSFLDDLTKEAEAEPEKLEGWVKLARARYRAALLNASFYQGAEQALDKVQELDPDNLEAIRTRGHIAYDRQNFTKAQEQFERYLKLDPGDPNVRTDLATTFLFQGQAGPAKQMYRQVITDHPEYGQAHLNLGIALHREGAKDEAKESFARARELATSDQQRSRIDDLIAVAEGRTPPSQQAAAAQGGSAGQGGQPMPANAETNADSAFQKGVDALFLEHRIVGPRVTKIDWSGAGKATVSLANFPMDKMPPVMRNKFKSGLNEAMAGLAKDEGIDSELLVELVDAASGDTMDKLDGKEWVGAFDESQYE